ncbi:hypothetical protein H6F67_04875 [Microcoleus sp. FACHB-1515]|uniref:hypothetical protein n=1 Tax=Cyanophyceae TaxID=3028117 RepID=UPI0016820A72|nr:hypothetical protein [Microcoleus sp. FACHB-1515]MBD2089186.1 hypothetical protein [Microcoleus sp. FACHB-1515]
MSYQDLLHPWVIYRLNAHLKHHPIARFRQRNDAEAYLLVVKQMISQIEFAIVFDPPPPAIQIRSITEETAEHTSMID